MPPRIGRNMPKKPKKAVKKDKRLSKEHKDKTRMRHKMNLKKIRELKQVPGLLQYLDNRCLENLEEWLKEFPDALKRMAQNQVKFGLTALKYGMLNAELIGAIQERLAQFEQERKKREQTGEAQGSEAVILPPHTPSVNSNLSLPKEYQSLKAWQTLLIFLRDGSLEKMGVKLVDQALRLLELGFAKSVDPTMNQESTMQGDLHGSIRDKLLKQQALAKAKNAERTEKQKQERAIFNEYKNLDSIITWKEYSRPVAYTGLVVSQDPDKIFGPFSLSEQELQDLLDKAKKDAIATSLPWIHQAALTFYTGSHFAKLNSILRTDGNEADYRKYAHYLVHLTNALSLLEKLPEDQTTVYRGTGWFELKIQPGGILVFQAPTSASKSMRVANGFVKSDGIYFVIKALTAKSIEDISLFQHEREVLFPPNSHFEVKSITRNKVEIAKVLQDLTDDDIQNIHTMVVLEQFA
jgi:hypothetical protein